MRFIALITILLMGGLLFYGIPDFPDWGDPASPASLHVSPYFIEHAAEDTHAPNIVTAVLADYRGYDTMFETAVIFSAGLACFFLLRTFRQKSDATRLFRHIPTGVTLRIEKGGKMPKGSEEFEPIDSQWVPYDMIINLTCRLIVPFVQLFALYVIAHGHYSPGGGFQGGGYFRGGHHSVCHLPRSAFGFPPSAGKGGHALQRSGRPDLCRHRCALPCSGRQFPGLQPFGRVPGG